MKKNALLSATALILLCNYSCRKKEAAISEETKWSIKWSDGTVNKFGEYTRTEVLSSYPDYVGLEAVCTFSNDALGSHVLSVLFHPSPTAIERGSIQLTEGLYRIVADTPKAWDEIRIEGIENNIPLTDTSIHYFGWGSHGMCKTSPIYWRKFISLGLDNKMAKLSSVNMKLKIEFEDVVVKTMKIDGAGEDTVYGSARVSARLITDYPVIW